MPPIQVSRRNALGVLGASCIATLSSCSRSPPKGAPKEGEMPLAPAKVTTAAMPMRPLGKTGVTVSAIGIGGYHIGVQRDEKESIRIVRTAIDRGITFLDNCWDYNEG